MAGGKETPRQKLIGMMYLVLTALLALQVSSAIILKFKFLDDSLMAVNSKTNADNDGVKRNIEKKVGEQGNRANDKAVLDQAAEVRTRTAAIIKYLDDTRNTLITKAGGLNPDGSYKDPSAEDKVAIEMIGANPGKGEAYKMKDKLNDYANFLKKYNPNIKPLAI